MSRATRRERLRLRYRENDPVWFVWHVLAAVTRRLGAFFDERARGRAVSRRLPGTNTRQDNREGWNRYDWSGAGEEWTVSPEWRESIVRDLLRPNLGQGGTALEIGPGAGRWTQELPPLVSELILTDVSERVLEICRVRFGGDPKVSFLLTDGAALDGVADRSVDSSGRSTSSSTSLPTTRRRTCGS